MPDTITPPSKGQIDQRRLRHALTRASLDPGPGIQLLDRTAEVLVNRLDELRFTPATILELGDQSNAIPPMLHARYPQARLFRMALDQGTATRHAPALVGTLTALPYADNSFDLVISNMALHWSNPLRRALKEIRRVLRPNGILLLSMAGANMLTELQQPLAQLGRPLTLPLPHLQELGDLLAASGFTLPVADREAPHIPFPSLLELLQIVRQLGAINPMRPRPPGLLGKGFPEALALTMALPNSHTPLRVTVEVLFGHGCKPAP